jgi:hypothetical protein
MLRFGVLLGDESVGKEALIQSLRSISLPPKEADLQRCTYGNVATHCTKPNSSTPYFLKACNEKEYKDIRNADFVLMCYSVLDISSYYNLLRWHRLFWRWAKINQVWRESRPPIILVGTHTEQRTEEMVPKFVKERSERPFFDYSFSACPLPLDIVVLIFEHLNIASLSRASRVCKLWNNAICCSRLWKDSHRMVTTVDGELMKRAMKAAGAFEVSFKDGTGVQKLLSSLPSEKFEENTDRDYLSCCRCGTG